MASRSPKRTRSTWTKRLIRAKLSESFVCGPTREGTRHWTSSVTDRGRWHARVQLDRRPSGARRCARGTARRARPLPDAAAGPRAAGGGGAQAAGARDRPARARLRRLERHRTAAGRQAACDARRLAAADRAGRRGDPADHDHVRDGPVAAVHRRPPGRDRRDRPLTRAGLRLPRRGARALTASWRPNRATTTPTPSSTTRATPRPPCRLTMTTAPSATPTNTPTRTP